MTDVAIDKSKAIVGAYSDAIARVGAARALPLRWSNCHVHMVGLCCRSAAPRLIENSQDRALHQQKAVYAKALTKAEMVLVRDVLRRIQTLPDSEDCEFAISTLMVTSGLPVRVCCSVAPTFTEQPDV